MVANFRWFIAGQLAGGSKPCYPEDVAWLRVQGLRAVVSLEVVSDLITALLHEEVMWHLVVPIDLDDADDIIEPSPEEVARILGFVRSAFAERRPVYLHCSAGIKRTGWMARKISPLLQP